MLKNLRKRTEGFTIVEVMIVLAIAGLILLIVFLAIPALQRNSRNTRVRNDASKSGSLMQEVINNNNGQIPVNVGVAGNAGTAPNICTANNPNNVPSVLQPANAGFNQVTCVDYSVFGFTGLPANLARDSVYVRSNSICGAGGNGQMAVAGGSGRQYTITYLVESPGTGAANGVPAGFTAQCIAQ